MSRPSRQTSITAASAPSSRVELTTAVVICAYTEERWDQLVEAVESVFRQSRTADQVIMVIDHDERLLERAAMSFPDAHVIPNDGPQGLSGGRNTGVQASSADVVAFLDDDAAAAPDWLAGLLGPYDDATVAGVGGGIDPVWATGRPSWWPLEFDWVVGCTYRGMPTVPTDVRNVIGANMSFRRLSILAAGGFDVSTGRGRGRPLGGEETELSIRIAHHFPGARIRYEPAARVRHFVPARRSTFRYFLERCYAEGLSKARVTSLAGRERGLASERTYATRTLPRAVVRNILGTFRRGDIAGLARAAVISIGLFVTMAGYAVGGWHAKDDPG